MSGYTLRGGPVVSLEDRVTARATRRKQSASAALPRPAHAETGIDGNAAGAYPTEPPQQSVRGGDQGDNLQPVQADAGSRMVSAVSLPVRRLARGRGRCRALLDARLP